MILEVDNKSGSWPAITHVVGSFAATCFLEYTRQRREARGTGAIMAAVQDASRP